MTTLLLYQTKETIFLASDSQTTLGNFRIPTPANKIIPVGLNCLVGGSGSLGSLQQILSLAIKNLRSEKAMSDRADNINVVELTNELARLNFHMPLESKQFSPYSFLVAGFIDGDNRAFMVSCDASVVELNSYFSEGSGQQLALTLLQSSYNPEATDEEVAKILYTILKQVSTNDIYTDGLPQVFCIKEGKISSWEALEEGKSDEKEEKKELLENSGRINK